jgi:hypothetical protein
MEKQVINRNGQAGTAELPSPCSGHRRAHLRPPSTESNRRRDAATKTWPRSRSSVGPALEGYRPARRATAPWRHGGTTFGPQPKNFTTSSLASAEELLRRPWRKR